MDLRKLHHTDRIHRQYQLFAGGVGLSLDDSEYREEAEKEAARYGEAFPETTFAVGESLNGEPFEIALSLLRYGHRVSEIYGTVTGENFVYIRKIAELSPETRIYTNLSPSMMNYNCSEAPADVTIGADAGYYQPDAPNVPWNQEVQPFGYAAVIHLFRQLYDARVKEARK